MPRLHLPTDHSDTDRALACAVAEAVESDELFVAWTLDAGVVFAPEAELALRPGPMNTFAQALADVLVSFVALWNLIVHPSRRQRADSGAREPGVSRGELEGADL
ncbi:MAG TPA: hypothetical protein VES79_11460 [Solirubrobacteraceae bacterium]|nr:hypothetical protein [Solirubrobacteraceae bacterium]